MEFFKQPNQRTTLHKKTTKVSLGEYGPDSVWEKVEETYQVGDEGPRTDEFKTTYLAGCNHVLHSPDKHDANCSKCNAALCKECARLRCSRCLSIICSDCSRLLHGVVFCRKCRAIVMLQAVSVASIRSLHSLFSREIC